MCEFVEPGRREVHRSMKTKKESYAPENGLNHLSQYASDGIASHPLAA
jgi:hypothetical protein